MTASLLLLVLTCNGLGKFTVSVDQSSSFYLTVSLHPELAESDHGGLFLFVSAGRVFIASVGIIPLRSSSVNLILVSVLFGFTSAKASLGWAFPLSMVIVLLNLKIFLTYHFIAWLFSQRLLFFGRAAANTFHTRFIASLLCLCSLAIS